MRTVIANKTLVSCFHAFWLARLGRGAALAILLIGTCTMPLAADEPAVKKTAQDAAARIAPAWQELFDGKTLGRWQVVKQGDFAKHGPVTVQDGCLALASGTSATGIRWGGEFPKTDYEITLEARRVAGDDFFCGLTFPVQDQSLTLILGGWGGWVVGVSCINGRYAIDNETCQSVEFEQDRWYPVRVRVTGTKIQIWLDDRSIIELPTLEQKFAVSIEMEPCLPLGVATWNTTGQLRKIRYRSLTE